MNQQYDPFGRPANGAVPPNNGQNPYNNDNNPGGYPPPGYCYQAPYGPYCRNPQQAAYFEQENRRRMALRTQKRELRHFGNSIGLAILVYFILQIALTSLLSFQNLRTVYQNSPVFQSCFNMLFVSVGCVSVPFGLVALVNKKRYTAPIIPTKPLTGAQTAIWVAFGMLCCVGANFVVSYGIIPLFEAFGYKLNSGGTDAPNSVFACLIALIGTAIVPAICEEFAMRCCCEQLLRKYGKGFSVFCVSIAFGLLHGNVVQLVFAFLGGMVFGFITVRTDNVIPAILIHALNNGMSVVTDIVSFASTEQIANSVTAGLYLFWIVAGAAATIYLLAKKQLSTSKDQRAVPDPYALSFGQRIGAFFGTPGMIISFIPLILLTISNVENI